MKKTILSSIAALAILVASSSAFANGTPIPEVVQEGVEISGGVFTAVGWQHDDQDARANLMGGMAGGAYGVTRGANADHFKFTVPEVEIDINKSFGENIRLRADIDFGDVANTGAGGGAVALEQGYVTANLAAGNGIEFLIGKFNAPVGVEPVDLAGWWFNSYATPFSYLTPGGVTGAKIYYAFSDMVDLHLAVVNDLNADGAAAANDQAVPSGIFRLGFNWGDGNTLGVSGGFGPEQANNNSHYDFFGDLDLMVALTDTVTLAAEAVYRQSNPVAGVNAKAYAAFLALNYEASDVWNIAVRADYMNDNTAGAAAAVSGTNFNGAAAARGTFIAGTLAAGYMITDDAKLNLEARYDWNNASAANNDDAMSATAKFSYAF